MMKDGYILTNLGSRLQGKASSIETNSASLKMALVTELSCVNSSASSGNCRNDDSEVLFRICFWPISNLSCIASPVSIAKGVPLMGLSPLINTGLLVFLTTEKNHDYKLVKMKDSRPVQCVKASLNL